LIERIPAQSDEWVISLRGGRPPPSQFALRNDVVGRVPEVLAGQFLRIYLEQLGQDSVIEPSTHPVLARGVIQSIEYGNEEIDPSGNASSVAGDMLAKYVCQADLNSGLIRSGDQPKRLGTHTQGFLGLLQALQDAFCRSKVCSSRTHRALARAFFLAMS